MLWSQVKHNLAHCLELRTNSSKRGTERAAGGQLGGPLRTVVGDDGAGALDHLARLTLAVDLAQTCSHSASGAGPFGSWAVAPRASEVATRRQPPHACRTRKLRMVLAPPRRHQRQRRWISQLHDAPAHWPSVCCSGTEMRLTLCSAQRASISFL